MNWAVVVTSLTLFLSLPVAAAEDFNFDIASYQKKALQMNGFLEANIDHQRVATDSYASQLYFLNMPSRDAITENTATFELSAQYKQKDWSGRATYHAEAYTSELRSDHAGEFYEALLAYQPKPGATLELGKKAIKWGKGYAWNPVGFVERPKNPDDPELAREGYVVATADLIKSFSGDIQTLALTPVYLPATESVNSDYGVSGHDNVALKLYTLYNNIDIDVMWLSKGSKSQRFGVDFARNISTNFEVHGEWAAIDDVNRLLVASNGSSSTTIQSARQWLLGLRYLSENETTIIAEYYHNSAGYSDSELTEYFRAIDFATATSNNTLLTTLATLGEKSYLARTPGKEYLYLRVSNKEPFDWLYVTPALTLISNLQDNSYSLSPEIVYTGIKDIELRAKATWLHGEHYSEFGEKRNAKRFELRLRYFF